MTYVAPTAGANAFTCPHCGVYSKHRWYSAFHTLGGRQEAFVTTHQVHTSVCDHCTQTALWWEDRMLRPDRGKAPAPHPRTPDDVKYDYEEAARISAKSPRGAAALLRLAVQKLTVDLGGKGKDLNTDIGDLVKQGLPATMIQALDIVRVTGNNAVHPGQIDTDDPEVAGRLFELINIIVEYMIAMPERVASLHGALPPSALKQIEKRDAPKP
jgi:hypothetical protein